MDGTKAIVLGVAAFFTAIATISIGGCHEMQSTERAAIHAGLVQKTQPAVNATVWTKP